jgi:hypothetical protein
MQRGFPVGIGPSCAFLFRPGDLGHSHEPSLRLSFQRFYVVFCVCRQHNLVFHLICAQLLGFHVRWLKGLERHVDGRVSVWPAAPCPAARRGCMPSHTLESLATCSDPRSYVPYKAITLMSLN